jgi:2-polyprenyl-6-methoxyphenol hydroxylase-like FAD-dependent oxidoreductase
LKSWNGRVTLIGDAAHTMPPFGGNGANTAFKDVKTLLVALSPNENVAHHLRTYETQMLKYSRSIIDDTVEGTKRAHMEIPFRNVLITLWFNILSANLPQN